MLTAVRALFSFLASPTQFLIEYLLQILLVWKIKQTATAIHTVCDNNHDK